MPMTASRSTSSGDAPFMEARPNTVPLTVAAMRADSRVLRAREAYADGPGGAVAPPARVLVVGPPGDRAEGSAGAAGAVAAEAAVDGAAGARPDTTPGGAPRRAGPASAAATPAPWRNCSTSASDAPDSRISAACRRAAMEASSSGAPAVPARPLPPASDARPAGADAPAPRASSTASTRMRSSSDAPAVPSRAWASLATSLGTASRVAARMRPSSWSRPAWRRRLAAASAATAAPSPALERESTSKGWASVSAAGSACWAAVSSS
mmetsp:Transcript_976/g.3743  ORF Transcript_976/g.3743 Transcript_976/m.3743 type:complete len:266 (-) Transcript_976:89-886(-)